MIKIGGQFSGVGAFDQALKRLNINYENIYQAEWDKYARATYLKNYEEPKYYVKDVHDTPIQEITEEHKSLDLMMFSPPCQAFSLAGKRLGKDDKRGILFFNSYEFIQMNKPRYFIFENVKGLLSTDNGRTFQEWINMLGGKSVNGVPVIFPYDDSVPYHIYWKVINAKDFNVPQNRERVFIVGIRDDEDNNFSWAIEQPLTRKLKDVLEEEVNEKYFLSEKMINVLSHHKNPIVKNETPDKSATIHAGYFKMGGRDQQYLKIGTWRTHKDGNGFREIKDGNSPTIPARSREDGSGQPVIKIKSATPKGYEEATEGDSVNFQNKNSKTRRGRVGKNVAQTLDTGCEQAVIIGYTRDAKGKVVSRNIWEQAGTIHTSSGGGGNTDQFVMQYSDKRLNETIAKNKLPKGEQRILDTYNKSVHEECPTLKKHHAENGDRKLWDGYKIRRLTPRECFRLMDFPDNFYKTIDFNNTTNSQGILLSLQNKKDIKWNAKELDVIEKQKLKECVCSTIKDGTNTVMKIMSLNTHTEEIQNAQLKIAVEMFTAKDIAQNTTILTENGAILYLVKNNNQKSVNKHDKKFLILEEKEGLEKKGNHYTDYYMRFILEENLKEVSISTILTTIQTIMICLTYIYSIPKENTISVILSYKNSQKNFLKGELLNLKMGGTILSDSQLYKQAGNSIVVAVLASIINKLNLCRR